MNTSQSRGQWGSREQTEDGKMNGKKWVSYWRDSSNYGRHPAEWNGWRSSLDYAAPVSGPWDADGDDGFCGPTGKDLYVVAGPERAKKLVEAGY